MPRKQYSPGVTFPLVQRPHGSLYKATRCTSQKGPQNQCQVTNRIKLSLEQTELNALEQTGTWKIVDLPSLVKPIGCIWVYKVNHNEDGSIKRYKAHLVSKDNQIEGLDYFDTFSLVAKVTTVRLVIALASINHWFLHQLDVNNAFLHRELHEDVYMIVPPGVVPSKPNQVCKLPKSLYGLKQASRKWYEKLTSLLINNGYIQATSDTSLFTKKTSECFTTLLVYVDPCWQFAH